MWVGTLQELNSNSSGDVVRIPLDIQDASNFDDLTIGWDGDGVEARSLGKDGGDGGQDGSRNELVTHFDIKVGLW